MILEPWEIPVLLLPVAVVLSAWGILYGKPNSPWQHNKDIVRDAIAAVTLGIALDAFIRDRLTAGPAFEYECTDKLVVHQATPRVVKNPVLVLHPIVVDAQGNSPPTDPTVLDILRKGPKKIDISSIHPDVPFSKNLRDVLDDAYPGIADWLTANKSARVTQIKAQVEYIRWGNPYTAMLTRDCR